jgi:hypothetical protein
MYMEKPSIESSHQNDVTEKKPLPDALHAEHLNLEETRPIQVAIGRREDYGKELNALWERFTSIQNESKEVDYFDEVENHRRKNFKNAGEDSYVISTVDSSDKFSHEFRNCTSLIVAGKDKDSGENVSILTHQDPYYFLHKNQKQFAEDLRERLLELKSQSKDMTVDAVIVGGNYVFKDDERSERTQVDYIGSVRMLAEQVKSVFGFEPVVVGGPKDTGGGDNLYYDNKERRAFLVRPNHVMSENPSFNAGEIEDVDKEKWKTTRSE